jgi:2-methylisocitrate lyase-like PEP mutase family enzyme
VTSQKEKALLFAPLHVRGEPLILFNAWDAGSAKAVVEAGARAVATGSWSVAAAQGYADGEAMPLDLALANSRRIADAVDVPVTIDFEGGYAGDPDSVGANAAALIETGAIGCNFEDRIVGGDGLYEVDAQCARIGAIRAAADSAGLAFFINARTDLFLHSKPDTHEGLLAEALDRGSAYAEAGANGLFVPGLGDEALIERACAESPLPVNVMVWPGATPPLRRLAELGVARISHAGGPWRIAMEALKEAARTAHALGG